MKKLIAPLVLLLLAPEVFGQRLVDKREQAEGWYLPVHGQAFIDGRKTDGYQVRLFEENEYKGEVPVDKKGRFLLELDIDKAYTVELTKDGYERKLMLIDTHLPEGLVEYPDYECYVNLTPEEAHEGRQDFYTDFPTAIIRYDSEMEGFYHSEHYLEHIQLKLGNLAQASF